MPTTDAHNRRLQQTPTTDAHNRRVQEFLHAGYLLKLKNVDARRNIFRTFWESSGESRENLGKVYVHLRDIQRDTIFSGSVFFQISDQTENEAMIAVWPAEHGVRKE